MVKKKGVRGEKVKENNIKENYKITKVNGQEISTLDELKVGIKNSKEKKEDYTLTFKPPEQSGGRKKKKKKHRKKSTKKKAPRSKRNNRTSKNKKKHKKKSKNIRKVLRELYG